MNAKTIITIVLVVFIIGAVVWLNVQTKRISTSYGVAEICRPFFLFMEDIQCKNTKRLRIKSKSF